MIKDIRDEEKAALSRYTLTGDGVLGPDSSYRTVFGVFTRLPHPSGRGYLTLIASAHYPIISARIAETLTDDRLASEVMTKLGWSLEALSPAAFEMLFAIELSPGDTEGEGYPKLLCARTYDEDQLSVS